MRRLLYSVFCLMLAVLTLGSCKDSETYAEQLKKEKKIIANFIKDNGIKVISQSEFYAADSVTDVSKNEFVQLASGVYMQIVDKGSENIGDTVRNNDYVLVRFEESVLLKDSVMKTATNLNLPYLVDKFRYVNSSSSISGIFISGAMVNYYQSTTVPAAWLVPLKYIRDGGAVKLIVPSKMGHSEALQNVETFYYDIRKYQLYR